MGFQAIAGYLEVYLNSFLGICMFLMLILRFKKMQRMGKAANEERKIRPSAFIIRSSLLIINCLLMITLIIINYLGYSSSFSNEEFNFNNLSWTLILLIIINILQIATMRKEYRRDVPFMRLHQLYWIIDLLLFSFFLCFQLPEVFHFPFPFLFFV